MQKQIATLNYWLGLLSPLIALGLRTLNAFGVLTPGVIQQGRTICYMSFSKGALPFFLITIASYVSVRSEKT